MAEPLKASLLNKLNFFKNILHVYPPTIISNSQFLQYVLWIPKEAKLVLKTSLMATIMVLIFLTHHLDMRKNNQ